MNYRGVEVDLTMARVVSATTIPRNDAFLMSELASRDLEPPCLRSLNGYRATRELLTLVPRPDLFKKVLRVVKVWAKKHGLYSQILGFLGGASWAILVAKACQLVGTEGRQEGLLYTVHRFFVIFSGWAWPDPVYIKKVGGQWQTWDHCMPIITSSLPQMNSAVNISPANCALIQAKCHEASLCLQHIRRSSVSWPAFFSPTNFFREFPRYLLIAATSREDSSLWFGSVEAKLRQLVNHIGFSYGVQSVRIWPRPFKQSEVSNCGSLMVKQLWFLGLNMTSPGPASLALSLIQEPLANFRERCEDDAARMTSCSPQEASSFRLERCELLSLKQLRKFLPKNFIDGFSDPYGYWSNLRNERTPEPLATPPPAVTNINKKNNKPPQGNTVERKHPEFGVLLWPRTSTIRSLRTRQV